MDREPRAPRNRIDPRSRWYWLLECLCLLAIAVAALVVPAIIWSGVRTGFLVAAASVGALLLLWTVTMPFLRYRVHRWEASDTAVYAKTGWLSREWKVAPLSRIQSVEAKRNPLHQFLGLSQVSVTTASAHGEIVIQGLDRVVADDLVAELTVATESTVGDAT
ncbi:hypothetical protein DFR67_10158 [Williamsia limnetica]|uniref:YdbS-like PH domain-containing protein n=1 Tax=Williamsia limnetica TaxID=882452 RepID=A0A318RSU9_WILLI|nr:PH domain-containing protein [Williamsia limnetica]PYE20669.1 hypothetical protein DFR67_10158 [Williamsia limnetica]